MSDFNIDMETIDYLTDIKIPELIEEAEEITEQELVKLQVGTNALEGKTVHPLLDRHANIISNVMMYIEFLNTFSEHLEDYKGKLDEQFDIDDFNRQIYLDLLGLDEWLNKIKETLDVDSEEINEIIKDSNTFIAEQEEIEQEIKLKEEQYNDIVDIGDGEWFDGEVGDNKEERKFREEVRKFEKGKVIVEEVNEELSKLLKFDQELDLIIDRVAKMKGIEDIEDSFSIESLIDVLSNVKESGFKEVPSVNLKDYQVPFPESNHDLSVTISYYMDELSKLFPELNDDELFKLLLYSFASLSYGGTAWNLTWSGFERKYSKEIEIIINTDWYKSLDPIKYHNTINEIVDVSHFSATVIALLMDDTILINIWDAIGVNWFGDSKGLVQDVDDFAGGYGDWLTNGDDISVGDLNADYMAIMVATDIQNEIDPIVSIQVHYDEVKNDSIETWDEFFTRLEGNK